MKSHVQVAVIGGGLVGCSILYHLTKLGYKDVVLLEREELTSGSTWHAAAGIHGLHDNNNVSRMQYYTMNMKSQSWVNRIKQNCWSNRCLIFEVKSLDPEPLISVL